MRRVDSIVPKRQHGQKPILHFRIVGFVVMTILVVGMAHPAETFAAGPYRIDWYTMDGGGGASTGGPYTLTGTIGQPDAGWGEGGGFILVGGFGPGGPLCTVAFDDFARFAAQWFAAGQGLPGDLDGDNDVDFDDLVLLTACWLRGCPSGWPLR